MPPRPVSIEPADYARDGTAGQLVGETEQVWVLRREHLRIGILHVHFPKSGFTLSDAVTP